MPVTMVQVALIILNLKLSGVGSFFQRGLRNNEVNIKTLHFEFDHINCSSIMGGWKTWKLGLIQAFLAW
jgi:hypothetical protein